MARKIKNWNVCDQHTFTESINNENAIRRKWYERNKQRLLDNLKADNGELVKTKLKELRQQKGHDEIYVPIINITNKQPMIPSTVIDKIEKNSNYYMRPVDPKVVAILYDKDKTSHETRKNYLQERYKIKPEDKFYIKDCTNWNYGWYHKDFPLIKPSEWGQRSIVREIFGVNNISGIKRDPDVSRKLQATFPKYNYHRLNY